MTITDRYQGTVTVYEVTRGRDRLWRDVRRAGVALTLVTAGSVLEWVRAR
jgi:hypothetical protein